MPRCPICNEFVKVSASETADAKVNEHILSGCKKFLLRDYERGLAEAKKKKKRCDNSGCSNPSNFETVVCAKCARQFCLSHRHPESHDCKVPVAKPKEKASDKLLAKLKADKEAREKKLRERKEAALASSVSALSVSPAAPVAASAAASAHLVKKLKAEGDNTIKDQERFYLEVEFPRVTVEGTRPKVSSQMFFFHRKWTIGMVIERVCRFGGVENNNNIPSAKRLQLVGKRNGAEYPVDIPLELLEPALISGDVVVLGYAET